MEPANKLEAWLTCKSGALAGRSHLIREPVTRIGRATSNDLVLDGSEADGVSAHHAEIRQEAGVYRLVDLNSTNGSFVGGARVTEAKLSAPCSIRLGPGGPEIEFALIAVPLAEPEKTVLLPPLDTENPPAASPSGTEKLLSEAVAKARQARRAGAGNQTLLIMRSVLEAAVRRSHTKFKVTIWMLAIALAAVSGYGALRIRQLKQEKGNVDAEIRQIEKQLQTGDLSAAEVDQLVERLGQYQDRAVALQRNLFYKLGVRGQGPAFVEREIKTLLEEFGAESYSIPPEFVEQVNRFIQRYQERDRANMQRAVSRARREMETIRRLFEAEHLPPDLAYMALVESAFISESSSPAGAVGLWQFTPATARAYGMKVNKDVDERLNLKKSTLAASRYIRELILDFGSGSSVMLALAAYNVGPGKVKQAVRKVQDPIKQRNFWYLYRVRALPAETREYVPKIIAAIIIGRNLEHFGF